MQFSFDFMSALWSVRNHTKWGPAVNTHLAVFLLGVRRLELSGAVTAMDPAVMEEMLRQFTSVVRLCVCEDGVVLDGGHVFV